ncbi:MAG: hypothetical protein GY852_01475 [bacterium]|nr:hypothetical protein [bacterium]
MVFKKEWIGHTGTLTEKITMNAVYPGEVGETVTYNLYFGDMYLDSCEMPYGEGEECHIKIDLPTGLTLEGKTYQIVGGYGIEDFDIYILEPGEPVPLAPATGDVIAEVNETIEEELNETEEIVQLCEGVSCEDYCDWTTLYSGGACNPETGKCEYSSEECENGCSADFAICEGMENAIEFDVFSEYFYWEGVVANEEKSITVTANVKEMAMLFTESGFVSSVPIEGVDVRFELSGPGGINIVKEGKTGPYGETEVTFVIPQWDEIFPPREGHYYGFRETDFELEATASKHDFEHDFDEFAGPYTIRVESPAIVIDGISIDPNPAQAYGDHMILIKTLDHYEGGPAHFAVWVPEGVLSYEGLRGEYGGAIGFEDSWGTTVVHWEAPQRGLTPYEFDYANELKDVGRDYGIATGSSLVGVAFPVVKQGETIYGMYGDLSNIGGQMKESMGSLSFEESLWRAADVGISEVKLGIGAVNLVIGNVPGGSLGKELIEDTVGSGLELGQVKLKQKAAEARLAQMETRSMDMFVEVEVRDAGGYYGRDYLVFEMEYLWEKEG